MDWTVPIEIISFIITIGGINFFFRKEAKEDNKRVENLLREDNKRMEEFFQESHKETNCILRAIHEEMKDFHGRLCTLEERSRK